MKKAFIIFAHNLPNQLNEFIKQIVSFPNSDVFVHVSKQNEKMKTEIIKNPHVFISEKNIDTPWGSDALLRAMLIMLEEVFSSDMEYDYVLFCSGQDLLVRNDLDSFLEENRGQVFVDGKKDNRDQRARLLYKWPSKYRRLINSKTNPTKILRRIRYELCKMGVPFWRKKVAVDTSEIVFYRSYFWGAYPSEVAKYILDFSKNNTDFMSIYEGGLVAEEGFFLTVVMNSVYSNRVSFFEDCNEKQCCSLTFSKPFTNNHPPVLTIDDIGIISNSKAFFARKFDERVDDKVISFYCGLGRDNNS